MATASMMANETWLSAYQAIANKFADGLIEKGVTEENGQEAAAGGNGEKPAYSAKNMAKSILNRLSPGCKINNQEASDATASPNMVKGIPFSYLERELYRIKSWR